MLTEHATAEDFEGFLKSASRPGNAAGNARVMRHLLTGCSLCWHRLDDLGWDDSRLQRLFQLPVDRGEEQAAQGYDYSPAFAAAEQSLEAFFTESQRAESSPEELMAELAPLPLDEQARWVSSYSRFHNSQLVKRLIDGSHAARYENPGRMLHLANLAHLAAESCTAACAGSALRLADLRSQAARQYGNALRVSGRMREAEEAFADAQRFGSEGTGDPPLRASLCEQMASLRIFQRRFQEAVELSEEAGRIYRDLGETHLQASTMVQKAIALLYAGEPESAVRVLNRAIPLIDHDGDPHLLLAACHNLIRCYIDLAQPEQALSIYFEARNLYRELNDSLIALRAGWQEGQLLRDLGHLRAAESALLRARQGFLERELFYEAAVVSLDVTAVYLKLGEAESLQRTVSETVPIFTALGVDREALAALLQLQQVAHQSRQAFELIRFLSSRLEQLPHRQVLR
ncbi:MAG TPA: tetratricopeptide repeat protein [Thermoanaerobaculia bacterium]